MGRRGNAPAAPPQQEHLSRFAHALIPPFKSKDDLTKALKATADALSAAPQAPDGALALGPLANALVDRALLAHKDKDIRLRSAFCLAQAFRVAAPDAPYTPAQLSDAFAAFSGAIKELSRGPGGSPAFDVCLQTLEAIATVRCSVLALDLDGDDEDNGDSHEAAAVGLADACFAAVCAPRTAADEARKIAGAALPLPLPPTGDGDVETEEEDAATLALVPNKSSSPRVASTIDAVEAAALDVLSTMLDEADELPAPLVDAVVSPLLPPARDARPEAAAFARKLLKKCEVKLQPAVQRLLVSAIENGGVGMSSAAASSSSSSVSATERAADLIAEVAAACPQALLPVIPKLIDELQVEDEARRTGAVAISVSLLSAPTSSTCSGAAAADAAAAADNGAIPKQHHHHQQASLGVSHKTLLDALLRRSRDRSATLRATVASAAPGMLAGAPDSEARYAVLAAAQGRLLDPDAAVRAAAASAICACARGGSGGGGGGGSAGGDGTANNNDDASASAARPSSPLLGLRSLGTSSLQPLLAVGDRLRDASPLVARGAAAGLLSLFRAHAAALHAGEEVSSTEELVLWIPGRLLAAAAASADLRNFCSDVLFARPPSALSASSAGAALARGVVNPPSLLPGRLSPRAVARQWATIYMTSSRAERAALCALLRSRGCAAVAAADAAAARAALRAAGGTAAAQAPVIAASTAADPDSDSDDENEEEEHDDVEEEKEQQPKKMTTKKPNKGDDARAALRRLESAISRLSSIFPPSFPSPSSKASGAAAAASGGGNYRARATAALRALIVDSKDNAVVRSLAKLAAPGTRSVDAAAAAADLVARAPAAGHAKDAAKVLAARIAPSLIPPEVIPELFLAAAAPSSDVDVGGARHRHVPAPSAPDGRFAAATLALLTDAAASDPSLFARAAPAVADAIAADDALLKSASLSVLASAGGAMRSAADADAEVSNNDAAEDVLDALADAAAEAAREGPPAACRTAVRAVSVLLPTAEATRVLRGIATRHVRHLAYSSGGGGGGGGGGATRKSALSDPRKTRVALAALGALGAAAPSVFATHAAAVSDFVMSAMLPAPASAFGRGGGLAATGVGEKTSSSSSSSGALPPPSLAAAAKAEALEDLAAALIPDPASPLVLAEAKEAAKNAGGASSSSSSALRPRMTPEAAAVADRLVPELTGLVDPDAAATDGSEIVVAAHAAIVAAAGGGRGGGEGKKGDDDDELSPAARADAAALRLGAARALLLLLKSADSRVPPASYIALSLVLQDQESDVRAAFREALVSAVVDGSLVPGGGRSGFASSAAAAVGCGSRAAKLAAPLALSAVDPSKSAQRVAFAAMQRFVAARRDAVALAMRARAASAARGQGGGGGKATATTTDSLLHEAPEYAMTYLLQILAHHPDFPTCGPPTGEGPPPAPEDLAPFVTMLQLAIEPLVAGAALAASASAASSCRYSSLSSSSRASAGAALHALCKVLRAVRGCDDATAEPATGALAVLADVGLAVVKLLAAKHGVPLPSASLSSSASGGGAAGDRNPLGAADGGATTTAAALFGGGGGGASTTALGGGDRFPGGVPLPRSLYKTADPPRPKLLDGALLPPGWTPVLVEQWMAPVGSGGGGGPKQQQHGKRARPAAAAGAGAAKKPRPSAVASSAASKPAAAAKEAPAAVAPAAASKKVKPEPKAKKKKRAVASSSEEEEQDDEEKDEFNLSDDDDENVAPPPKKVDSGVSKPSIFALAGKNKSVATTTTRAAKKATTTTKTAVVAPKKKKAKASDSPEKAPAAATAAATRSTRQKQQQQKLDGWTTTSATQTTAEETEGGRGGAAATTKRAATASKRATAAKTKDKQQTKLPFASTRTTRQGSGGAAGGTAAASSSPAAATRRSLRTRN